MGKRASFWKWVRNGSPAGVLSFLIFLFLTRVGVGHPLAVLIGSLASCLWGFFIHKLWTFKAEHNGLQKQLAEYLLMFGVFTGLNMALMAILVDLVGMDSITLAGWHIGRLASQLLVRALLARPNFRVSEYIFSR